MLSVVFLYPFPRSTNEFRAEYTSQPITAAFKLDEQLPAPQLDSSPRPIALGEGGGHTQSKRHKPPD